MKNKSTVVLGAILTVLLCSGAYTTIGLKDSDWIKKIWTDTNNHLGVIADELTLQNRIRECELTWSQIGENTVIECVTEVKHEIYRR
jgi:hypothetical protein